MLSVAGCGKQAELGAIGGRDLHAILRVAGIGLAQGVLHERAGPFRFVGIESRRTADDGRVISAAAGLQSARYPVRFAASSTNFSIS